MIRICQIIASRLAALSRRLPEVGRSTLRPATTPSRSTVRLFKCFLSKLAMHDARMVQQTFVKKNPGE